MAFLFKNHPFAVEAFFNYSLVLTYAVPKNGLQSRIPACLELDTFQNDWAFVTAALVQTRALRPKGFPRFLGNDFFLIGYRIFVRYKTSAGKRLRGLYILKSETNSKKMALLGSIFTHYNYSNTDIRQSIEGTILNISSHQSRFDLAVETSLQSDLLPSYSPFNTWKDARRFAGPLPFTFSYDVRNRTVLIIEGLREQWKPTPVQVLHADFPYFHSVGLKNTQLASAFIVRNISYEWKRGRIEQWNG